MSSNTPQHYVRVTKHTKWNQFYWTRIPYSHYCCLTSAFRHTFSYCCLTAKWKKGWPNPRSSWSEGVIILFKFYQGDPWIHPVQKMNGKRLYFHKCYLSFKQSVADSRCSPSLGEAVCILGLSESHRCTSVLHQSVAVPHPSPGLPVLQLLA